ncbi:type II toxin-antitoxin system Phd/YefM family antitoxin [Companilactobacillus huachuanensis]|uniref:Antitoxin n=1 Tax=Companilactobacillus huachuanensis TaxID=2559914 RepID=A0ABW1RLY0_9LACO|nr:type II toxin-antitoxin system Phd/YefM family antitoxin [Companilactobacillus huachuanensis]
MMKIMTNPSQARKDLYDIIKYVNEKSTPIEINGCTEEDSAVIMSAKDYKSFQETLHLLNDGTLDKVHKVMKDDSGETDITNGIDWDKI